MRLVKDCPNYLGLGGFSNTAIKEVWRKYRDKQVHMAFPGDKVFSSDVPAGSNYDFNMSALEQSSVPSFILGNPYPHVDLLVYRDLSRISGWILSKLDKSEFEAENVKKVIGWLRKEIEKKGAGRTVGSSSSPK